MPVIMSTTSEEGKIQPYENSFITLNVCVSRWTSKYITQNSYHTCSSIIVHAKFINVTHRTYTMCVFMHTSLRSCCTQLHDLCNHWSKYHELPQSDILQVQHYLYMLYKSQTHDIKSAGSSVGLILPMAVELGVLCFFFTVLVTSKGTIFHGTAVTHPWFAISSSAQHRLRRM